MLLKTLRRSLPDFDRDDLLDAIGLETRRSTTDKMMPALALFGAGVLVGVGVGLLLAPKPGHELRADVRSRLKRPAAAPAVAEPVKG